MQKLRNIKWLPVLMALSILAIASFQYYWLRKAYEREDRTLDMRTNFLFRETVRTLQASKLKLDKMMDSSRPTRIFLEQHETTSPVKIRMGSKQKMVGMLDVMMKKLNDSAGNTMIITRQDGDSVRVMNKNFSRRRDRMMQFLFDVDSLQDSIRVKEL